MTKFLNQYGIMETLSSCVRGVIVAPPGRKFVIADLSNIEGRALAWLAGEEWKLQAFRDFDTVKLANGGWMTGTERREEVLAGRRPALELDKKGEPVRKGHDLYKLAYAASFSVKPEDVTKDNRQVGKVQELALGYQGGAGAFVTFAAGYGIDLDDLAGKILSAADPELVEESTSFLDWLKGRKGANTYGLEDRTYIACDVAKRGWRKGHPAISTWWPQLEDAFEKAVTTPKQTFAARSVHFNRDGSWLRVRLPSGRFLCYPNPRVKGHEEDGDVQGEPEIDNMARMSYEGVNQFSRKWARLSTYGGKLAENCIAEGTDVLTDAGWVPIEEVTLAHRVWDGEEWVSHNGLVTKGHQYVKPVFGVEMTDDHLVLTEKGWKNASSCEGHNRAACRIPDGFELPRERRKAVDLEGSVRLRQGDSDACLGDEAATEPRDRVLLRMQAQRDDREAQQDARYGEPQSVCGVAKYAGPMHEPEPRCLEKLRRTWNRGVSRLAGVLRGVLARYGADLPRGADAGSQGQYARVLPCELPLGHPQGASEQHQGQCDGGRSDDGAVCGRTRNIAFHRGLPNPSRGAAAPTGRSPGRVAQVYDILNCGPRSRFVCRSDDGTPLIVHNCTQAFARDVLVYAMPLIEAAGYKLVMSVHDELIAEVPDDPRYSADHLAALMATVPPWASGLPLAAEGFEAYRYRK